jgi:hypothetical protein
MNTEDIIRMAREAGFDLTMFEFSLGFVTHGTHEEFEHFAALVAAAEREACLAACRIYQNDEEPYPGFQNGVACCIAAIKNHEEFLAHMKKKECDERSIAPDNG